MCLIQPPRQVRKNSLRRKAWEKHNHPQIFSSLFLELNLYLAYAFASVITYSPITIHTSHVSHSTSPAAHHASPLTLNSSPLTLAASPLTLNPSPVTHAATSASLMSAISVTPKGVAVTSKDAASTPAAVAVASADVAARSKDAASASTAVAATSADDAASPKDDTASLPGVAVAAKAVAAWPAGLAAVENAAIRRVGACPNRHRGCGTFGMRASVVACGGRDARAACIGDTAAGRGSTGAGRRTPSGRRQRCRAEACHRTPRRWRERDGAWGPRALPAATGDNARPKTQDDSPPSAASHSVRAAWATARLGEPRWV